MPSVSVIIPLYKSAPFIGATLDSVAAQTFEDFEVLCVDDCSPDATAEIVKAYAKKDKRVRYLAHAKNQGAPAFGRNTGLQEAKGEYVTFLDHDDSFLPTKLEELLAAMEKEKVDFICSNIYLVNAMTGQTDGLAWGAITGNAKAGFSRRLLAGNFVPPNSTLIRQSVFNEVGLFDTALKGADDFDMWYRITRRFPATVYAKPTATWRYMNSASISANDAMMIEDEKSFYQKIVEGGEWTAEEKEEAARGVMRNAKRLANRYLLKKEYHTAEAMYAQAGMPKMALAVRVAPAPVRLAYAWKNRRPKFMPLNLDFS